MPKLQLNKIELQLIKKALESMIQDKCTYVHQHGNVNDLDADEVNLYKKVNNLYIDNNSQ